MRIPILVVVLLLGLTSVGAAPGTDLSQPTPSSAAPFVKSDLLNSSSGVISARDLRNFNLHSIFEGDNVCYTMRSYIMARENRDSDFTTLVGYSTCQPSTKYELRGTGKTPKSDSR